VFSSPETMPTKWPKRSLASKLSAVAIARAEQREEAVEEPMILDQVASHRLVGNRTGEQLGDEAVVDGLRPGRLAGAAETLGEAFGNGAASR
jgi:hypothetical protein